MKKDRHEPELSRHLGPVQAPDELWDRVHGAGVLLRNGQHRSGDELGNDLGRGRGGAGRRWRGWESRLAESRA